jgi:hypothetical protein
LGEIKGIIDEMQKDNVVEKGEADPLKGQLDKSIKAAGLDE